MVKETPCDATWERRKNRRTGQRNPYDIVSNILLADMPCWYNGLSAMVSVM